MTHKWHEYAIQITADDHWLKNEMFEIIAKDALRDGIPPKAAAIEDYVAKRVSADPKLGYGNVEEKRAARAKQANIPTQSKADNPPAKKSPLSADDLAKVNRLTPQGKLGVANGGPIPPLPPIPQTNIKPLPNGRKKPMPLAEERRRILEGRAKRQARLKYLSDQIEKVNRARLPK